MGFSLRVNHKKRAGASHPNRDDQFQHIAELRERGAVENTPVISVDTKKKELVGAFRNPGAKWDRSPELVNDHDFRSEAEGRAIPYGIYDPRANAGTVFVGQTADTPAFAVDCIEKWWRTEGRKHYPDAEALQILADGGGSNSCTARAWKFNLQHRLCNRHGLRVTVAHYPPATSKWNPIEHRLFCEVSKNWAGRPLDSYETILKYLRTTRTTTGLRVRAHLVRRTYKTGVKVTDAQMEQLRITSDKPPCPNGTTPSNPCSENRILFLRRPYDQRRHCATMNAASRRRERAAAGVRPSVSTHPDPHARRSEAGASLEYSSLQLPLFRITQFFVLERVLKNQVAVARTQSRRS